jgi:hypothetical protein
VKVAEAMPVTPRPRTAAIIPVFIEVTPNSFARAR